MSTSRPSPPPATNEAEGTSSALERRIGVLVQVAYDGTGFSGWATQKDARTVEDTLRGAILAVDPRAAGPRGTSRTDAGVHAEGQLAAFDANIAMPPRGWVLTLNQHLPEDVAVRSAQIVPIGFSPRFASKKKRYRYDLLFDKVRDPLLCNRAWRIGYDMDMDRMEREARAIVGTHDFAAFRSAGDERDVTVRTIYGVELARHDQRRWSITIEGTAFLYNMVRILVGTLVDVGRGHLEEGTIARAIAGKDRALAGQTAPPHGLTLASIDLELPEGTGERWPP
ncbi:MAG: tRNA pseudouridine(38-40) synthase TruA [Myxococcales bacterium]|nr:tRNA pseudouridine(38-40) synthase TruA [Myxococcales bacterium]